MAFDIKFRAWDELLQEYFSWEDSVKFNNYHHLMEDGFDAVTLEQYVGMQDGSGKDIYVNDLVSMEYTIYHTGSSGYPDYTTDIDTFITGIVAFWPSTGAVITHITAENPEQFVEPFRIPKWRHINKGSMIVGNVHKGETNE